MRLSRIGRLVAVAAVALVLVVTNGPAANAAFYNSYTTVHLIPQPAGFSRMQGFAAGATYLYSIRIDDTDQDSRIYRTNADTRVTQLMQNVQNAASPDPTNPWLGHANDMALAQYDGVGHMFVLTLQDTGAQLVKLSYDGNTYQKEARYNIFGPGGQILAATGISRVSLDTSQVTFLFRKDTSTGAHFYMGSIGLDAPGGADIHLARVFDLDFSHAVVNGVDTDLSGWDPQGFFHYDPVDDSIYASVRKGTTTIVLVFRNVTTSSVNPRPSATNLSFRLTPASASEREAYGIQEFEGLALRDGRLYFNTNRSAGGDPYDGVHVVDGYDAR